MCNEDFEDLLVDVEDVMKECNIYQLNVIRKVLERITKEKKEMYSKANKEQAKAAANKMLNLMVADLGHTHSVTAPAAGQFKTVGGQWITPGLADILPQEQKQKGNTMYRDYDTSTPSLATLEVDKRNHLEMRLETMYEKKIEELRKHFGMNGIEGPKTVGDLKKFIAEGRIQLNENLEKNYKDEYVLDRWSNAINYLVFTDPSVKKDEAGFNAAHGKLTKAYNDTHDIVTIHDPIAGLEALKNFESQDFR